LFLLGALTSAFFYISGTFCSIPLFFFGTLGTVAPVAVLATDKYLSLDLDAI
jgi:hypothetical protein